MSCTGSTFINGQWVQIDNAAQPGYDGYFKIGNASPSGFTYTNPVSGLTPDTGGAFGIGQDSNDSPYAVDILAGAAIQGTNVTVTIPAGMNYVANQQVVVSGLASAENGTFTVASVLGNTFTYVDSNATGQATGGGSVNGGPSLSIGGPGATVSAGTVTINTTTLPSVAVGQLVTVSGVSAGGNTTNAYNGTFTVLSVSGNSFTYSDPAATGLGNGDGGSYSASSSVTMPLGASESGTTVTINTATTDGLAVGEKFTIAGVSVNGSTSNAYNGTFTVTGVLFDDELHLHRHRGPPLR